jgi:hypothetical protein
MKLNPSRDTVKYLWLSRVKCDASGGSRVPRVPVKSLYQWRYQGHGPRAHRVGRHLRYRWEDVEAWLATTAEGRTG